jgi:hypothetical protein
MAKTLKILSEESAMYSDVIHHAVYAQGLGVADSDYDENGKVNFESNMYLQIDKIFSNLIKENVLVVSDEVLNKIIDAFKTACETLGQNELEILTGYTWEQTQELLSKLKITQDQ